MTRMGFLLIVLFSTKIGFGQNSEYYKEEISKYTKIIESEPRNARAYLNRANSKEELKDYVGAISDYTKVIELESVYESEINKGWYIKGQLINSAYNNRGTVKYLLKDYTGAIADYNKVIEINPDDAITYYNRGNAKSDLKDYRGAIEDYTKTIDLIGFPKAYLTRGLAKIKLGQKDSGCLDLSKAGELGLTEAYGVIKKFCQ